MKIGIVSDTHGSILGWRRSFEIFKDCDIIIHAGDIFNHGPGNPIPEEYNPKELLNILNNLNKPILISKGNCDSEVDQMLLDIPLAYPFLLYQLNELKILVSHGHLFKKEEWVEIGKRWKVNILISGHTHMPLIEKIENLILVNPGSPSLPKEKVPTCGKIDLEEKNIKILNILDKSILNKEVL
jgi:putative phosphoesterase